MAGDLFLPALVLGEFVRGVRRLRDDDPWRARYETWIERDVVRQFRDRILAFHAGAARIRGEIVGSGDRVGAPKSPTDSHIAAVVRRHGLVLAARNGRPSSGWGSKSSIRGPGEPGTWLTMRRPWPTPRRLPPFRNTGRRAPRRPVHRWRGLTVSPVTAHLPSAGATLLPRAHVPVEASKPQTCSSTNATKDDAPLPPPAPAPLSPRSPPSPLPDPCAIQQRARALAELPFGAGVEGGGRGSRGWSCTP